MELTSYLQVRRLQTLYLSSMSTHSCVTGIMGLVQHFLSRKMATTCHDHGLTQSFSQSWVTTMVVTHPGQGGQPSLLA